MDTNEEPRKVLVPVDLLRAATAESPQDECSESDADDHEWEDCNECHVASDAYRAWNQRKADALKKLGALAAGG